MNYRTTLFLAFALAGCAIGYLSFGPKADEGTYETPAVADVPSIESTLIDPSDFENIVKVECDLRQQDAPWVFTRSSDDSGLGEWRVEQPFEAKAVSYRVDRIARQMTRLTYEVAFDVDGGSLSLADAGLDPPLAIVTVTNDRGESRTVEIGRSAGLQTTYVRLAAGDKICRVFSSMSNLFEDSVLAYKDQQLIRVDSQDVTRVEIIHRAEDGDPVTYVLSREDGRWMFDSPFVGRAKAPVEAMVQALAGIRVNKWVSDDEARLPTYGLSNPTLTIRATVVEEVEKEEEVPEEGDSDEADAGDEKPETVTTIYELHVSSRTPIDDDQKVYIRMADGPAVGLVPKSLADRLTPVEKQWRDMSITAAKVERANRIVVELPDSTMELVKEGSQWSFSPTGDLVEEESVTFLINSIRNMSARALVDFDDGDEASFGFDTPQVVVRLTIPGQDEAERIMVGGYTDEESRRMVYVRRNESLSVAKVRVSQVAALLKSHNDYRDRTIFALDGELVTLSLARDNKFNGGRLEMTFGQTDDEWRIESPVQSALDRVTFQEFLDTFELLRATRVVGDDADLQQWGLDAPLASVSLTYQPPKYYRVELEGESQEDSDDGEEAAESSTEGTEEAPTDEPQKLTPVEVIPPVKTVHIEVSEKDDAYYAKNSESPVVFEITKDTFDRFWVEYREGDLLTFEESQAVGFSIRHGDTTHRFEKVDDQWRYASEPDLPLAQPKVQNLLIQVKALQTTRYVRYGAKRLGKFGLDKPDWEITVTLDDQTQSTLLVSGKTCAGDPDNRLYAVLGDSSDVFLLPLSTLTSRVGVNLADLEAKD